MSRYLHVGRRETVKAQVQQVQQDKMKSYCTFLRAMAKHLEALCHYITHTTCSTEATRHEVPILRLWQPDL
eukprot:1160726-Pelagomonas_calceolata.AAC.5